MRGRWIAVLVLTVMLAGCGTVASSRPAAMKTGSETASQSATAAAVRAPAGSRAEALTLAGQLLSQLVVPGGARAAQPSPVPAPLRVASADQTPPYTVVLHRFVLVREPAATVHAFLLGHVPAGMIWYGAGLASGTTNTVTTRWVGYRPRSRPAGLAEAELSTDAMAVADGTLIRADAIVSWFPPRSAAEYLTAAGFRSVTVTATETILRPRTVTRTFTSPAVIGRLAALLNRLPAAPDQDVAAMKCVVGPTSYRLAFTPGVVVEADGCGDSDAITVNGQPQPRLWDQGALMAAARQLLDLLHLTP
jgi:uncharacterized protein YceK